MLENFKWNDPSEPCTGADLYGTLRTVQKLCGQAIDSLQANDFNTAHECIAEIQEHIGGFKLDSLVKLMELKAVENR